MKRAVTAAKDTQLTAGSATGRLLVTLLDAPDLIERLRALPGPAVTALVRRIGLEDAGEFVALLSVEQLTELLDDVLWTADAPGADESFDPGRFVTWLEVMLEAGDTFVADRLAELSEDLLTLAVSRLALVLELTEVAASANARDDGELVEKALDGLLHEEVGEYLLVSRRHDGWDALVTALLALDARQGALLERILGRCCRAAHEALEDAGDLYALLTDEEVLEVDAAAEREDRRASLGYVSAASARAFLGLAARGVEGLRPGVEDAVTRAYFRELDVTKGRGRVAPRSAPPLDLGRLLAGTAEPEGALAAAATAPREAAPRLRALLAEVAASDAGAHARALDELVYLANVVVTGDTTRGRPWRAAEASERVLAVCERGLLRLARDTEGDPTLATLARWGLVAAFRAGFREEEATRGSSTPIARRSRPAP